MPPSRAATLGRPTSLACLGCRESHLKCDGGRPACARCASRGAPCAYTPSRRGRRPGCEKPLLNAEPTNTRTSPYYVPDLSRWTPTSISSPGESLEAVHALHEQIPDTQTTLPVSLDGVLPQEREQLLQWSDNEHLVNLYYLNFHAGHPLLVPKNLYWNRGYPRFLKAMVEFVGSHFSSVIESDTLREAVASELERGDQSTPEMVQALVLYTITLLGRNEIDEGQKMLELAITKAVEMGMHRREYAGLHADNNQVEEESLRRTWYELYISDGCNAAFQRKSSFKTHTINADVLLPCEEAVYGNEVQPIPASKRDFQASVFADGEVTFSSFSYRIEAVRLLGRVLTITRAHGVQRDQVQAVDNALAAFLLHLPFSKSEPEIVDTYGELDELMFQAHVVIQYATIILHFPRGDLAFPDTSTTTIPGASSAFLCSCTRQHVHSIKAVDASKILSMLAAFRLPVQRHSPFLIYPLALAAIVQLSISAAHVRSSRQCIEQHSDRVKLILGVLRSFSRHWPIAGVVLRALNKMALVVFQPPRNGRSSPTELDTLIGNGIDSGQNATVAPGSPWMESFDVQDLQELFGLDFGNFCLEC
ncbi:hypothetical protein DPSP01_007925 [Paraphaeosphaeria sporulosa]|uniref:Zn(2)-C6 fungal-type domain-containing protein n=1 Tax=Paraphaeosphaeria sporulosa TaxID=1460663 RepID=A0A177CIA9_9PLEO|nr:uncharacterized protein CC84DRAFT_1163468 [Paraphaeosphaeria sporulosa]OAG07254.1 hypothetical protein CC84DRAFT_1163468 [Paraphaeosphaeria sporulosa]